MANVLPFEKQIAIVAALAEGCSIRSIERQTGVHRDTIMRLGVRVGLGCQRLLDQRMRGLTCSNIEVDEIWGFIGKKQKHATAKDSVRGIGDVWTFIALDSDSKIIPTFLVGKRDAYHAKRFIDDLAGRITNRTQISSDGLSAYVDAVERGFGSTVDYGQIVKTFAITILSKDTVGRYSPAEVVKATRTVISGQPNIHRICTSHVEKQNHTLRMHCRRLTRLTNAFSKKLDHFESAVSLNFAYYNFVKIHRSVRMTPAMAAGVTGKLWTVADLIEAVETLPTIS